MRNSLSPSELNLAGGWLASRQQKRNAKCSSMSCTSMERFRTRRRTSHRRWRSCVRTVSMCTLTMSVGRLPIKWFVRWEQINHSIFLLRNIYWPADYDEEVLWFISTPLGFAKGPTKYYTWSMAWRRFCFPTFCENNWNDWFSVFFFRWIRTLPLCCAARFQHTIRMSPTRRLFLM